MTSFEQIVVALLVAILARTYLPPLGSSSSSNKVLVVLVTTACLAWVGHVGAIWAGWS